MRISNRCCPRLLVSALVVGACFAQALPVVAAPAPLPEWDVKSKPAPKPEGDAKPAPKPEGDAKTKPAPLPDWDAAAKKPAEPAAKPKAKKPPTATQPGPAPEPEPEPEPEPVASGPEEPVPAEPEPEPAAQPGPAPEPGVIAAPVEASPVGPSDPALERRLLAERTARGELIVGGVLTAIGFGGVGAMTAGLLQKGKAEDSGDAERLGRANTMIAAGAVSGAFGLALGLALVIDGVRDLKAARPGRSARLRVAPSFGGLVVSGRF